MHRITDSSDRRFIVAIILFFTDGFFHEKVAGAD